MQERKQMNKLTIKETMTSLQVAEVTGKEHSNVMRDIRNLLKQGVGQFNFEESSYKNTQNKEQPMYILTKKGCLILASGYDAVLREKIIDRWEKLERGQQKQLPTDYITALEALIMSEKEKAELTTTVDIQAQQIGELKPKADYTDTILKNKGLVTVTQIAKDYGMSAITFNQKLAERKIQYKQSGQWLLYRAYHSKGYTHSETINIIRSDGRADVKMETKWTQKGRLFLYELLKAEGIVPIIERM